MDSSNSQSYTLNHLDELIQTDITASLKLLVDKNIEVYGLENNYSNPFLNLKTIPEITFCLAELGLKLKDGIRDKEDISSYSLRAQVCYARSLIRLERANESFCHHMSQKLDKNALLVAIVGTKHIPSVTNDDVLVEKGMVRRLGNDTASACVIGYPTKRGSNDLNTYRPNFDSFGSYDEITCCTVPMARKYQARHTLLGSDIKSNENDTKPTQKSKKKKKHGCNLM